MLAAATTQVIRSYLLSAAEEMRRTLVRTAFNPVIYEVFDFGISLYDRNLELTVKKNGKVTMSGRIVISADGKSRTLTMSGTDAAGKKVKSTSVYDKQ